jgi:hypothetical protein
MLLVILIARVVLAWQMAMPANDCFVFNNNRSIILKEYKLPSTSATAPLPEVLPSSKDFWYNSFAHAQFRVAGAASSAVVNHAACCFRTKQSSSFYFCYSH